jgi:poly(hydroxyalkanoate) depolymerase family esterase
MTTADPQVPAARIVTGEYVGPFGTRRWRLAVPSVHTARTPRPMLVMLHGCLQDAADIARGTQLDAVAEREGLLVLYPEQPESANARKCWNWFDAAHHRREAGEPALIAALVAQVAAEQGADPARVHLAGVSAGAAMATLLAVAYPDRFQTLTSVAGPGWAAATSVADALTVMQRGAGAQLPTTAQLLAAMGTHARAIPLLVVHGGADNVVSVRNATELAQQFTALHNSMRERVGQGALVRVELAASTEHGYAVREEQWRDEQGRAQVMAMRIEQLAHAWPHGDAAGSFTDPNGPALSQRIGAFVARYPHVSATP